MESHVRAKKATDEGRFRREIVPVKMDSRNGSCFFDTDEHVDRDASLEKFSTFRPAFKENGVVTMVNGAGISDGAAAAVLMSKRKAMELGINPLSVAGNVEVRGTYTPMLFRYFREELALPVGFEGGELDARFAYRVTLDDSGALSAAVDDIPL